MNGGLKKRRDGIRNKGRRRIRDKEEEGWDMDYGRGRIGWGIRKRKNGIRRKKDRLRNKKEEGWDKDYGKRRIG